MFKRIRGRNHAFWRWYEQLTALIGWTSVITLVITFWNAFAIAFGWPDVFAEHVEWFAGYTFAAVVWIAKADRVKYKITKDPRDEPHRKWWSWKHAQKFKPGETIVLREEGIDTSKGSETIVARCPNCQHIHAFRPDQEPDVYDCGVYGCKGKIDLRDMDAFVRL